MKKLSKHKIDDIVDLFIYKGNEGNRIITRQAGKWQGVEGFSDHLMKVYRHVELKVEIPETHKEMIDVCRPDVEWANNHFMERIGGLPLNPGEAYKVWPYASFKKGDGFIKDDKFDHTYMERFWPKEAGDGYWTADIAASDYGDMKAIWMGFNEKPIKGIRFYLGDYNDVINQLMENPLTRQAYLPIFFPEDTGAINSIRTPCTLGYLFEIFDGKLDITYYIRSCDVYRHFRNDIYMAMLLADHTRLQLSFKGLDVKNGTLRMKIANLHSFNNDYYLLQKKESKLRNL